MKVSNIRYSMPIRIISSLRRYYSVKRKYPIDPDYIKSLPVYEYGLSDHTRDRIYVTGNTTTGALGVPYLKRKDNIEKIAYFQTPKRLSFAEFNLVKHTACGFGFSIFSVEDNGESKLFGTGLNTDCQIGYHSIRKDKPLEVIFHPQAIHLPFKNVKEGKILKLSAGRAHAMILTNEGVFLMGNNSFGQCGRPIVEDENYQHSNYVNHIPHVENKTIIDVECGQDHSLLITDDGAVYSCGWGADGQTGLGNYKNCDKFTRILGDISSEKITKLSCRSDFVIALNDKGEAFGWGNAEYGQIVLPNNEQQISKPCHLDALKPLGKIREVAAGGSFCAVLTENREVFTWGYGILGTGPNVQQSFTPILLPKTLFGTNEFQPDNVVEKLASGVYHMAAVTNLGNLFTWGGNKSCCLGLGKIKEDQYFPLKVSIGAFVTHVSCGVDHTIITCKSFV